MLTAFGAALGAVLIFGLPFLLLGAAGSEDKPRGFKYGAITMAGLVVILTFVYYLATPTIGFSLDAYWKGFWWLWIISLVVLVVTAFAADDSSNGFNINFASGFGAALVVIMPLVWLFAGVWGTDRAHQLSGELKGEGPQQVVTETGLDTFNESDPDHIPLITPDMALNKARQSMNQLNQIDAGGFRGNASSVFELGTPVFQSVKNQAVYIVPATPSGWRDSNRVDGIVPFYFKINAEDPNAPAVAVSKDDTGQPIQIKYSPGGYFEHDINRLVWKAHNSKVRTDPTMEIDDNGRPYYTVTKDRLTLNKMPTVPQTLLVVDAQTGVINEYELNKVPAWVDRVYSQETVANMIDWWGHWSKAPWQIKDQKANRYKLAEDPVMVYTKAGTASYQAILTSWNSDTSASYLMTVDAKTGVAKAFTIPNLTLESVARGHIVNSPGQTGRIKYYPPHMVLYRIYGQLAWLSPVEVEGDGDHVYKGVGIVSATDNSGQSAVIGTNKADALAKFKQNIAKGVGSNAPPSESGNNRVVEGTVSWVNNLVADGNTVLWFGLEEYPQYQFRGVPNDDVVPELKTVHPGAKVRVGFLDVGTATVEVGSYDDLAITTPPVGGKK